jgi:hypothetical protein
MCHTRLVSLVSCAKGRGLMLVGNEESGPCPTGYKRIPSLFMEGKSYLVCHIPG